MSDSSDEGTVSTEAPPAAAVPNIAAAGSTEKGAENKGKVSETAAATAFAAAAMTTPTNTKPAAEAEPTPKDTGMSAVIAS